MKTFTNYLYEHKENIKHDNILIVCDIQKEFSKFLPNGYVEAVIEYCKNFNDVYQIWDSNKASKPSYKFPNEKGTYIKKYGTKFSEDLLQTIESLNKKYPNAKEGDLFEFDDVNSYVIRVKNNHGWFYVPEKMAQLFNSLKSKSVVTVGGSGNECILDIYVAMKSFGINPIYDNRYIYNANNSNKQKYDPEVQLQMNN